MNDDANAADDGGVPPTEVDCRPRVAMPPAGPPTWVLACGALAIGTAVLLTLNGQRETGRIASAPLYAAAVVPPIPRALDRPPGSAFAMPAEGERRETADAGMAGTSAPFAQAAPYFARRIPDFGREAAPPVPAFSGRGNPEGSGGVRFATTAMPGAPGTAGDTAPIRSTGGAGTALVYDVAPPGAAGFGDGKTATDGGAARASLIRNRAAVVAQGEVLPATLETPVNSTQPGPIRAIIARDVRGFDGTHVLIPRGSRLIGEYRADPQASRRRILATWSRLIRPDGVAIRIDSPVADALGGSGIPGRVDTHFLARFANATLQSALQIGVNLASRAGSGAVIVSNAPQMSSALGQTIIPGADRPPTVSARAGTAVSVFVARDLDFSGVPVLR